MYQVKAMNLDKDLNSPYNNNYVKWGAPEIPENLRSHFPNQSLRLIMHHSIRMIGNRSEPSRYTPVHVSLYLVPRNGSNSQKTFLDVVVLTSDSELEEKLSNEKIRHVTDVDTVKLAIEGVLSEILENYLSKSQELSIK